MGTVHDWIILQPWLNGTESDEPKAVEWFAKSVEQGNSNAMFNLASAYNHGFGVDQDKTKAFEKRK